MIYLLSRTGEIGYDENDSMCVLASSESEARAIANENYSNEGAIWNDSSKVECEEVDLFDPARLLLASFNAG